MGETRQCFTFITILTKLLGAFPVLENKNKVIFKWCLFRTFFFFALFFLSLVRPVYEIYESKVGYILVALNVSGIAIQLSLFMMAKEWPELTKECGKIDFYMKGYGFSKYLKVKLQAVCVMLMTIELAVYCFFEMKVSKISLLREVQTFSGWNTLLKIVMHVALWHTVMLRCCVDVFVISVSIVLATRFRQVVERISFLIGERVQNQNIWRRVREDYQRLCIFCDKWDNVLGYLILCSFMSNIYILLLELHAALSTPGLPVDKLFQILTGTATFLRCMMICYTAGNVQAVGMRIVEFIVLVPSDVFNAEIDRIATQIRQTQPALTGKQLFTVKHALILQIIGGVLSHEIILLQYFKPGKA